LFVELLAYPAFSAGLICAPGNLQVIRYSHRLSCSKVLLFRPVT